jgi:hypothetical protein
LYSCDDDNDSFGFFDLSIVEAQITSGTSFTVEFF